MTLALLALVSMAPQFAVSSDFLTIDRGGGAEEIYVKAINLGSGSPGHFPGDHAIDEKTYKRWFEQMSAAGFNAVRVFDVQAPCMYRALVEHNRQHADRPLFLLQGVWLAETANTDLYLDAPAFDARLAEAVDAVHGRARLPRRPGRAHGDFAIDASPWLLGWIVGRELEPSLVAATDTANARATSFAGQFVTLSKGSPTEAWAAARFEHLASVEATRYNITRPIALVSWPPLDPLHHTSAAHRRAAGAAPGLDDVAVDTTRITATPRLAGLFAAYSVYPYYPEFIWREPAHQRARDAGGVNPYLGYLERLRAHYRGRPLLVAEYGVPSSSAMVAREPRTGMHFGGLRESGQSDALARMTENIASAGCAGGAVFSWMDEWWKPTWIVRKLSDGERRPLWHDRLSPEEHFGLVAFDVAEPELSTLAIAATARVRRIEAAARHDGLVVRLEIDPPLAAGEVLRVALDTIDEGKGDDEFRLAITSRGAQLYLAGDYQLMKPRPSLGDWVPWLWTTREAERADDGSLRPSMAENIGVLETASGAAIAVLLPWTLLRFCDPSKRIALDRAPDSTSVSPGIKLTVTLGDQTLRGRRFAWQSWNRAPVTRERAKPALDAVRRALALLPDAPRGT